MSTPVNTIKQRTSKVTTADGEIVVRRMYHKAMGDFLEMFAKELSARAALLGRDVDGRVTLTSFEQLLTKLPELVISARALCVFMVENSTDDAAAVAKLDLFDWGLVLQEALKLNCGAELKNFFAGIRDALAPLLAGMWTERNAGEKPTPS